MIDQLYESDSISGFLTTSAGSGFSPLILGGVDDTPVTIAGVQTSFGIRPDPGAVYIPDAVLELQESIQISLASSKALNKWSLENEF